MNIDTNKYYNYRQNMMGWLAVSLTQEDTIQHHMGYLNDTASRLVQSNEYKII